MYFFSRLVTKIVALAARFAYFSVLRRVSRGLYIRNEEVRHLRMHTQRECLSSSAMSMTGRLNSTQEGPACV